MQSAEVAPPPFSMKFAWRGEMSAPPIRWPLRPQSSIARPAPSSGEGFLKTLPKVRLFVGWVALRCASSSETFALICVRRAAARAGTGPAPRPHPARAPSAGRRGRARPAAAVRAPSASTTSASIQHVAPLAAVRAGVHSDAAARGAGDRGGELEPGESRSPGAMEADRVRRAAARDELVPVHSAAASSPASLITSASTPSSCTSTFEPSPITSTANARRAAQRDLLQRLDRLGAGEPARGPPVPIVV